MGKIDNLLARLAKKDPAAVQELQAELNLEKSRREYGLVFEPHEADGVRMPGRKVRKGDNVHVLPPRGEMDSEENYKVWTVVKLDKKSGVAQLVESEPENEDEPPLGRSALIEDLVVYAQFDEDIFPGLVETDRVMNGGPDQPPQIVINGENYHALEAMLWCYQGKVDCIYIDPPYNSRNRSWKYNNNYVDGNDAYADSKWLAFMEERLLLAKRLLKPEKGVLIATIDEKEYLPLGMLLKQVFPDASMQMISSVINPKGSARKGAFYRCDEYIYILRFGECAVKGIGMKMIDDDKKDEEDKKSVDWQYLRRGAANNGLRTKRPNLFYPIIFDEDGNFLRVGASYYGDLKDVRAPSGEVYVWPVCNGVELTWQLGQERFMKQYDSGYIDIKSWNNGKPTIKYLTIGQLKDIENGNLQIIGHNPNGSVILEYAKKDNAIRPLTIWNMKSHNAATGGTDILTKLLVDRKFPYPKSLYAVEDCLRFFISDNPDALVMDFFSGSGTTAHAVMRLNKQYGGHRQCIAITNNEMSEEEESELLARGLRPGDDEWEAIGVCEYITKPRIRAAITGIDSTGKKIEGCYGIQTDQYFKADPEKDGVIAMSSKTGKPLKSKTIFLKKKVQDDTVPDPFPMADGFKENAVFFDLVYNSRDRVEMGLEFASIAPLLWLKAGGRGEMITEEPASGYAIADCYGVLFDSAKASRMADEMGDGVKIVYVMEDNETIFQQVSACMPKGTETQRLYKPFTNAFASYSK